MHRVLGVLTPIAFTVCSLVLSAPACDADADSLAPQSQSQSQASAATEPAIPSIALQRVWPELALNRPVQMIQRPDGTDEWYIVEQPGTIRLADMSEGALKAAPLVVNLRDRVNSGGNEEGLLSMAFHPNYPQQRDVFLYYTASKPRRSILSRFRVAADGRTFDPASEETIMEFAQPYSNHNGGTVLFGPDGFLYLSVGDGGAANDPLGAGQDMKMHLAKILRIDINKKDAGRAYAVPADNPFVGQGDALPEIWASGLRNVWRMHFDSKTGELWAGDVGQNRFEEIDLITKGGNYGWNIREGAHEFKPAEKSGLIDPVIEYSHKEGVSVTGGFVYRPRDEATAIKGLDGVYLYADFQIPKIWGIRMVDGKATTPKLLITKGASLFSSFAEAKDGTLYVLSFEGGQKPGQAGAVWRIRAR
ncbi:MAG: PQQ-dependent sugar dehydrogenase [Phycisphaerae bacterium]|nr:PQQ-dependent sugar dehydrogenase [Phycisphaerae bacterium]